jgi:integrase
MDAYAAALEEEGKSPENALLAKRNLADVFGKKTPDMVTQAAIRKHRRSRLDQGVTDGTIGGELRYLRAALNWAVREGHIDNFRPFKITKGQTVRRRWLTHDEFDALIEHTDTLALRVYLEIAIATASRPEKIYAIRWDDISLKPRTINFAVGTGKKKTRPMPINDRLAWVLGVAYQARVGDYVIENNGQPVKTLRRQFDKVRDRAKVRHCVLRDMRSTAASWAVQDGATMEEVAAFLNDSVQVVERHYAHLSPNYLLKTANRLM